MKKILLALLFLVTLSIGTTVSLGQAISQTGGSIEGTITDATGAAIPGATVVISSPDTGYEHTLTTDKAGFYSLGPLVPGSYKILVTATGFEKLDVATVVEVGTVTGGNEKLIVGVSTETVEVSTGVVQVNTEQIGVAGIVTKEQLDTLPINGRNVLDIAQVQPGVVLQSGQTFDPTKVGYSALGINGQNGRSTRVLLDGQDISDETVGTVVFNVPTGAIGEFQLNRSTQDVSGEVTSTGQLLLATQSGTNTYHGNLFGDFQDARAGSVLIGGNVAPFQRDQFGGYAGGDIIKNKLFFFGGGERIKQYDSSPVSHAYAYYYLSPTAIAAGYTKPGIYDLYPVTPDPFKDTFSMGRLDYNGPWGVHYFVRATYSNNTAFGTSGGSPYAIYQNQDNVPAMVGGADFTTGKFTHSIRYGYLKFINNLFGGAASLGSSVYNPSTILGVPFELIGSVDAGSGNEDAPQKTYQSSKQFRYDGTWTKGAHNIKYGGEVTRILQGGFAAFYNTFLDDVSTSSTHQLAQCASTNPIMGLSAPNPTTQAQQCLGDPLYGYKPAEFVFGNGNGSGSERPAFGLPGGGDFSWRMAAYIGDTWKVSPTLTVVAGMRWSVDTDRADQDLPTVTCGEVDASLQFPGCDSTHTSAPLFDFYGPGLGLGKPTRQDWANFGPQAGFVYSPGNHKLAIRGGTGIYYENNLFNNQGNARAQNTTAEYPSFAYGVNTYTQTSLNLPGYANGIKYVEANGTPNCNPATDTTCYSWPQIYAMNDAAATLIMSKLDTKYKAAAAVPGPNPAFIGYANGDGLGAFSAYAGPYKTPYSIQVNGGVSYELKRGMVLNVDYLHNATLKIPITVDTNHVGAARYLNTTAAQAAVAATLTQCGAATVAAAVASGGCPGGHGTANGLPYIAPGTAGLTANPYDNSAAISDFANNGLDSGIVYLGGESATANGVTPGTGAAFAGANPNVGEGGFILPVGKSAYDALQIVLQQQRAHPFPGIVRSNTQISYSLSRAVSNSKGGSNEFFAGSGAYNQDCVNCNIGRDDADRSNQLSLSGSITTKYNFQIGMVGHFFSAPPSTLTLAGITGGGQIYTTDLDGDGTTGDLIPGTRPGAYMHEIKGAGLANLINNYNNNYSGKLTPAGQALVANGFFTQGQLYKAQAHAMPLTSVPTTPVNNSTTRTFDASFKYPITYLKRYREGLVLTPGVSVYNVFNMANFGSFSALADTTVTPTTITAGSYLNNSYTGASGLAALERTHILRGFGNGTYDQGGPRSMEFSLKLDF